MGSRKAVANLSAIFIVTTAIVAFTSQAYGNSIDMLGVAQKVAVETEENSDTIWGPTEDGFIDKKTELFDRGQPPCLKKEKDYQELMAIERELSRLWYEYKFVEVELNRLRNIERNPLSAPRMTDEEWEQHQQDLHEAERSHENIEREIALLQQRRKELIESRACERGKVITQNSLTRSLVAYATASAKETNCQSSEREQLKARLDYVYNQISKKREEWNGLQRKKRALDAERDSLIESPIDPNWTHEEHVRHQEEDEQKLLAIQKEIVYVEHEIDLIEVDTYELRGQRDLLKRRLKELQQQ